MVEWANEFGVQVFLNQNDKRWIVRPSSRIHSWRGTELDLFGGVKLLCLSGHFEGSSVLFWPEGDGGRGVILSGDTIYVVSDRRFVSFMYSYPNLIPLPSNGSVKSLSDSSPRQVSSDEQSTNGRSSMR